MPVYDNDMKYDTTKSQVRGIIIQMEDCKSLRGYVSLIFIVSLTIFDSIVWCPIVALILSIGMAVLAIWQLHRKEIHG